MAPYSILRTKLLRSLAVCGNYWIDEDTLHIQINLSHPGASRDEIITVLQALKVKGYVDTRGDEISGITEWRLTDIGRKLRLTLNS